MMAYQQRVNQFRSRIDFDDPSTTKPQSLAKSAVLQALEDEEREQSRAGKGLKRVAWPPPAELGDEYQHQQSVQQQQQQQQPYHYPPQQPQHQPAQQQPPQIYPQQQQQHYQQPHTQQHQPRERIIPIQRPEPSTQQPQYQPQPTQAFQPLVSQQQQQQQQQQLYQQPEAIPQQYQQQPQQQSYQQQPPVATVVADSQFPFVTTLRKEAPMSQEPNPVYHTEPVAAIYQGGTNMRGDQKWPPEDVKKQSELENEERRKLAQQPAFRPRKVQKDYSDFFAKNALNATYPGYRAPPGTQHHS